MHSSWTIPIPLCILLALRAHAATAEPDYDALARSQFLQAYAGASTAPRDAGDHDSDALRNYPLYPYLQSARIRFALSTAAGADPADAAADAFLALHAGEPVTRELYREWLASLARREQWSAYLEQYRDEDADATQRCNAFTARVELQRFDGLAADISEQWRNAKDSILECDVAFDWLRAQDALTPDLIEARARLALDDGNVALARRLADELPAERAAPLRTWIALVERPSGALDDLIANPGIAVEPDALLDGFTRLARSDPEAAVARLDALIDVRHLDKEEASPMARAIALGLAWNRSPKAPELFDRVRPADMDDAALEWHARASLWNGDWVRAAEVIASMPPTLRGQSRWRYWAARTAEKNDEREAAKSQYESLLPTDNYYAALAAARLHERFTPHPQALPRDQERVAALAVQPGLVRARELRRCSLYPFADAEWGAVDASLDDDARRQSIHLASDWGWYDRAIVTAARLTFFEDYALLFPRPFDAEVKAGAKLSGLPPALIYATLRQESLYRADAVSGAGALGLLQLRLETARMVARRNGRAAPTRSDLFDPAVNVPLGAAELRAMLDRFAGALPVALAAYNAGPGAAARWLPPGARDMDVWIENIPYNETRTYVQRVLWHSVVFAWLATNEAQDTKPWLGKVGG
jgi:soluble lytic murein transglycosylase